MMYALKQSRILTLVTVAVLGGFFAFSGTAQAANPTAALTASPQSVVQGSSSTLSWSSTNADSCTGTGFSTGGATSGSISISPNQTTTYTLTCSAATPYTWQKGTTDVTDLWCNAYPAEFENYYTKNQCPGNVAPTGACGTPSQTCFVNDWQTKFGGVGSNDIQSCNLITETYSCSTGSGSNTAQASKSVTVTVTTPPPPPPPAGPTCTLDLTQNNISWNTTGANNVTIVPLTNSPSVPGQSATIPAGTKKFGGDFGAFKAQYANIFQADASAHGGVTLGNASFKANKATADRLCALVFPGTKNGTFQTDTFSSPKNNTIAIWNGLNWNVVPAKGNDPHLRYNFTCVTAAPSGGTLALSGLHNFIPPLGVGTHTYKLTATGPNGSQMCTDTITILPPPPTVDLTAQPSTISQPDSSTLSWESENATSCIGTGFSTGGAVLGSVSVSPSATKTYSISCTGPGGTATDTAEVTVTPSVAPFCDLFGTSLPVGSGNPTTIYYASSGMTSFTVDHGVGPLSPVNDGTFTVYPTVTTTYTGTANGPNGGASCSWTITVPPPPPSSVTLYAGKIICENESDLPNWSGGADITPTLVYDFLDAHEDTCYLAKGWSFEYADGDTPNPGDNTIGATGGDWTLFSDTGNSGYATVSFPLSSLVNKTKIWLREVNQSGYVPFTGVIGSSVSAEMWCSNDVLNYDNYEQIVGPTIGSTYYCVAFNAPTVVPPGAPTVTLTALPTTIESGESSTLTWTSANTTTCASTDFSTGGATSGSVEVSPLSTTEYSISCTGPGGVAEDTATVTVEATGPACSLNASETSIHPGEAITLSWNSSNATTGLINGNVGNVSPVSGGSIEIFPSDDTTYIGMFTGPEGSVECSVFVDVKTGGGGGGGGGGGFNQPTTVLLSHPVEQPLVAGAFVSLSEIPYTGFEAGPALAMIFWIAVALFAALASYYLVGQGSIRYLLAYVSGLAGVPTEEEIDEASAREHMYGIEYPSADEETTPDTAYLHSSAVAMPVMSAPVAQTPSPVKVLEPEPVSAVDGIPAVTDVIESRAHAAGVLISPEAVSTASTLSNDRAESLKMFGDILNRAIQTIPREDGWVMLTSDRFDDLRKEMGIDAMTHSVKKIESVPVSAGNDDDTPPVNTYTLGASQKSPVVASATVSKIDVAAASQFAGAVLSGDRDTAFSIIRSFEADKLNPLTLMTSTATVLDRIYRLRKGGTNGVDPMLIEKSQNIDDEKLHELVSTFAHSLDHIYANPFTGVKLALAQAFEIIR